MESTLAISLSWLEPGVAAFGSKSLSPLYSVGVPAAAHLNLKSTGSLQLEYAEGGAPTGPRCVFLSHFGSLFFSISVKVTFTVCPCALQLKTIVH